MTAEHAKDMFVSQAFCSALPVRYTDIPADRWSAFAGLVLEAAYKATLCAAVINAQRFSSAVVFLTELGGGAFGNDKQWIHAAIRRALNIMSGVALDVRLVSYRAPSPELVSLVQEFAGTASSEERKKDSDPADQPFTLVGSITLRRPISFANDCL